ncbi:hypothetical protein [Pseudomonas sp. 22 E 5]|jgi:hypothetical protein|nr:hypothetical protein [Pseudomonas sp. 31 E 5]CRM62217.1 hypothetical protein [Pseudomonas sp. 31 E 6]CRM91301.1 hypothetical protein [Pseudomonas sp. 22 E 5]
MGECQLMNLLLTHCHREQAPSHIWITCMRLHQRKARRSTLPTVVLGNSVVRNSTYLGTL